MAKLPFPLGFKIIETQGTSNTGSQIDERQVFASDTDRTNYDDNFFYEGLLSYTVGDPYHVSGVTSDAGFYYRDSADAWVGLNSDTIDDKHADGTMDSTSAATSDPTTGTNIVNHVNYLYTLTSALSTGRTWDDPVLDVTTTVPGSPTAGDRYAINGVGTGDWTGHDGDVAIFTTVWTFEDPSAGWAVLNLTDEKIYSYITSTPYWIQTSGDLPVLSNSVDGIVNHTWYTDLNDVVANTGNYLNKNVFGYVVVENEGSGVTGSPVTATLQQDSFTLNLTGGLTGSVSGKEITISGTGTTGAPLNATYWTSSSNSSLTDEVNLGALTTGLVKITVAAGVATPTTATIGTDYEGPLTFSNGLVRTGGTYVVKLGGRLSENATLALSSYSLSIGGTDVTGSVILGSIGTNGGLIVNTATGVSIGSDTGGKFTMTTTGCTFLSSIALGGIKYSGDYTSGFVTRSLVDKGYVDTLIYPFFFLYKDGDLDYVNAIVELSATYNADYSYEWFFDGASFSNDREPTTSTAGVYTCTVTNTASGKSISADIEVYDYITRHFNSSVQIENPISGYILNLTSSDVSKFNFSVGGRFGVNGITTPTALIHLAAGTATASSSPIKFTAGTNLTTPEAGALEWDGANLYITQTTGPTRKTIAYIDSYEALVDAATIVWDCTTGLNKTVTISTSRILSITNAVNGISGDLILTVSSGTPTLTLPGSSRLNGSMTSLASGVYHLCWTYSTVFDFNIALYA